MSGKKKEEEKDMQNPTEVKVQIEKEENEEENLPLEKGDMGIPPELIEEAVKSVKRAEKKEGKKEKSEEQSEKISELEGRIKELEAEKEDLSDRLLRLAADFDNYRKRVEKEKEEMFNYGHANLIKDILIVVDNLERAIEVAEENRDVDALLKGVELTLNSFWNILKRYGVEPLEAEGKPFDPNYHEAITLVETGEVEPGIVVKEFQKGYKIKDRLLRPSRVGVSSAPQGDEEKEQE